MMRIDEPASLPIGGVSKVAAAVASRMNAILPDGFACIANETSIILVRDHVGVRSLDLADAPDWRPDTWAEDLRAVFWQVLSDFQDEIIEQTRTPWPRVAGSSGIAVPHVQVGDGSVRGWYGTKDRVVLALAPIGSAPPADVTTDPPDSGERS